MVDDKVIRCGRNPWIFMCVYNLLGVLYARAILARRIYGVSNLLFLLSARNVTVNTLEWTLGSPSPLHTFLSPVRTVTSYVGYLNYRSNTVCVRVHDEAAVLSDAYYIHRMRIVNRRSGNVVSSVVVV